MDQNSEVINRAINETLKQVDRARRRRGGLILGTGIFLCLFAYIPPLLMKGSHTNVPAAFLSYIGWFPVMCVVYGGTLLILGSKARILYLKYFGRSSKGRVVFYTLLLVLSIFLNILIRVWLGLDSRL